jgi:DNA-binding transcriptional MerR regulator
VTGTLSTPVEPGLRRIGDVAEETGLTTRTIRYYEEVGLLAPAAHVTGANRRYDHQDVERLRLIKRLREVVGLSLAEVRTFLEMEGERRALSREYYATSDHARQLELLERVEPILVRRVALLERKLQTVQELLDEERARLDRVRTLRSSEVPASN